MGLLSMSLAAADENLLECRRVGCSYGKMPAVT